MIGIKVAVCHEVEHTATFIWGNTMQLLLQLHLLNLFYRSNF